MSILITSVLNCASDRLAISSSLSSFSGVLLFHLGHIALSQNTCEVVRGEALGILQGRATLFAVLWTVCGGGVREGTMQLACSALTHFPANPRVRLGVSPTVATPAIVHSQL